MEKNAKIRHWCSCCTAPLTMVNVSNHNMNNPQIGSLLLVLARDQDPNIHRFNQNWTNVSDRRFKKNIQENVAGLAFINQLRPVTYNLDMEAIAKLKNIPDNLRSLEAEEVKSSLLQTGFIAQEVEMAARQLGYDFSGVDIPKNNADYYGLRYAEFTVPLVKAVQELSGQNTSLQNEIDTLRAEMKELKLLIQPK